MYGHGGDETEYIPALTLTLAHGRGLLYLDSRAKVDGRRREGVPPGHGAQLVHSSRVIGVHKTRHGEALVRPPANVSGHCAAGVDDARHVCFPRHLALLSALTLTLTFAFTTAPSTMFADELKTLRRLGFRHVSPCCPVAV